MGACSPGYPACWRDPRHVAHRDCRRRRGRGRVRRGARGIVPRSAVQARRHNMEAFEVVNRQTGDVVGTLYLTNDGDVVRFEPDLAPLDVKTNDRPVDDGLLAVLRKMRKGGWMMARAIRADSMQYHWLLNRRFIHPLDAWLH